MTNYKYVDRKISTEIDWSKVGGDITKVLTDEAQKREKIKTDLDAEQREFSQYISDQPQGDSDKVNKFITNYANDASEYSLIQNRLLKSGQLKLKDYLSNRQNLRDGSTQAFDLAKEYQAEYKEKMDRMMTNDPNKGSQNLEGFLMGTIEGFANFSKSKLYIDQMTGTVSVAKMIETKDANGVTSYEMDRNRNSFATVSSLRNRIKTKYDRFNTDAALTNYVSGLGTELNALREIGTSTKAGSITSVLDITKRKGFGKDAAAIDYFEQAETKMLESMLNNKYNVTSILTNSLPGSTYDFTYDEAEAKGNSNLILLRVDPINGNPTPDFETLQSGKDQKEAAMDFMRTRARMMYDKEVKINPYTEPRPTPAPSPTDSQLKRADYKEAQKDYINAWNNVFKATTKADKNQALDVVIGSRLSKDEDLTSIKFTDKGTKLSMTFTDPTKNRIIDIDPNMTLGKWAQIGNEFSDIDNEADAMRLSGGGDPNAYSGYYTYEGEAKRQGGSAVTTDTSDSQLRTLIEDKLSDSITEDEPTGTISTLKQTFSGLGFTFAGGTDGLTDDYILITAPNGEVSEKIAIDDMSNIGKIQTFIIKNRDIELVKTKFAPIQ